VNLRHVPEDLRPPQETPDPDNDPTKRKASVRENRHEFLRRNNLKLSVSTVTRLLVETPSSKLRHVTKTRALHVFVSIAAGIRQG